MRWIPLLVLIAFPVCTGCDKGKNANTTFTTVGQKIGTTPSDSMHDAGPAAKGEAAILAGDAQLVKPKAVNQPEPAEKRDKPRKIRYTGDMKIIVEKLDDAEETLDAVRDKFDGDYEKAEVNRSANVVRSGTWKVRIPVKNLGAFRKAVAKIGEVEKDTLDSDDMTTQYYDLERHITNLKAREKSVREFLVEIGKKDPRYMEVWRELDQISNDIDVKEGRLKLWANLTDLTTFTITMREKEPYDPKVVQTKEPPPPFTERVNTTWEASWDTFLGVCQRVTIVGIWVAPWSPIILVALLCFWLTMRRIARSEVSAVPIVAAAPTPPVGSKTS